jgi:ATP-dependent DNA helicase PIF1
MTDLYQDDLASEAALSDERVEATDRPVPCEFICGKAGVGKTYGVMRAVAADRTYGILTATTGIAAVNLSSAITIHSTLGYSDTASLQDIYLSGRLTRKLHELALAYRRLIVDEGSMIDAQQLDLWYRGVEDANRYRDVAEPLGITIVGDFGQLPPVRARWAFDADCWPSFAAATTRLEKVWRQDTGPFLDALNLARAGLGREAAETLAVAGATFHTAAATEFDGTTILPKNEMVSRYNAMALDRVRDRAFSVTSQRWGLQRKEWGLNLRTHEWGIPQTVPLKVGAYVMILANARDFSVVNGDCGHILDADDSGIDVHLIRGDKIVRIEKIVRGVELRDRPEDWPTDAPRISRNDDDGTAYLPRPHFRGGVRRYVLGQIEYLPVRLAYASTVHKSQGLTLDRVQVDYRDWFFGKPAMLYVALSRCRTLEGLRLVGMREKFAKQCAVDPRVKSWL